jgi:transcriptional regulator with XRE-family HTH domain
MAAVMPERQRHNGPSTQLQRAKWLVLQLERRGHPEWKDENGDPIRHASQAEIARRTGLTTSYLNAIKYPERSGNADIGSGRLAKLAEGVGIDIRFFFDRYEGERDFMTYLPSALERRIADNAIKSEVSALRTEFRTEMTRMDGRLRVEIAELHANHAREVDALRKKLVKAETAAQMSTIRLEQLEQENNTLKARATTAARSRR